MDAGKNNTKATVTETMPALSESNLGKFVTLKGKMKSGNGGNAQGAIFIDSETGIEVDVHPDETETYFTGGGAVEVSGLLQQDKEGRFFIAKDSSAGTTETNPSK